MIARQGVLAAQVQQAVRVVNLGITRVEVHVQVAQAQLQIVQLAVVQLLVQAAAKVR